MITGTKATIKGVFRNEAGELADPEGPLTLEVVDPDGGVNTYNEGQVTRDSLGSFHKDVIATVSGLWNYRWLDEGQVADEGTFPAESVFDENGEPDLTDLRVLVPAAKRAMEGPYGSPQGRPELTNTQVYNMVADACADVILYSGNLFGHELEVKKRDPLVGFPTEWNTNTELTVWEGAVIVTQAALNYFFHLFRDLKTSEKVMNEGTSWEWTLSANVLKNYLETLKENRDKALEGLMKHHPVLDRYASNIRVRDQATVAVLEWWDTVSASTTGGGLPGGQEAAVVPWFPGGESANP